MIPGMFKFSCKNRILYHIAAYCRIPCVASDIRKKGIIVYNIMKIQDPQCVEEPSWNVSQPGSATSVHTAEAALTHNCDNPCNGMYLGHPPP